MRKRREKGERAGKYLRGRGEDFGGVADELRRRRRSRNFRFHGRAQAICAVGLGENEGVRLHVRGHSGPQAE